MATAEEVQAAEAELYRLTGIDPREIKLLRATFDNPETKLEQQRLFAKVEPKTRSAMPELAIHEEVSKAVAELRKEGDALKAEREQEKKERARLHAIKDAMDDPAVQLRAEEVAEVEKLMTSRYIGNYKDAARLLRAESVSAPRLDSAGVWLPGQQETDDKYFKDLWNTPLGEVGAMQRDKLSLNEAHTMLHDFKTGQGQRKYAALMSV